MARKGSQGMQAARPYVDDFLSVHNLYSLEQLGAKLATLGNGRPERWQRPSEQHSSQSK